MHPSRSADKMLLLLTRDRPRSSYTIDTPTWDNKNRCCGIRNNPCVGNRNVTIALVGFVAVIVAVAGVFAYVHGSARGAYGDDETTATTTSTVEALTAGARSRTLPPPPPSPAAAAATPRGHRRTASTRRRQRQAFNRAAHAQQHSPGHANQEKLFARRRASNRPRRRYRTTTTTTERDATSAPPSERAETSTSTTTTTTRKRTTSPSPVDLEEDEGSLASLPLPKQLVPRHYSVLLHPHNDGSHFVFTGMVKITAKCVESTREIVLHSAGIQVNTAKVTFNAKAANKSALHEVPVRSVGMNSTVQQVILHLSSSLHAQMTYDISISYVGTVNHLPRGLYKTPYTLRSGLQRWMAFSRMKPRNARRVFPCYDDPSYRATFDVEILRRKDFSSISSMPILKIEMSNHGDYVNDVFVRTPPIPTYLLGFAVTDFAHIGNGIVKVWTEPSSSHRAEFVLQNVVNSVEIYEKYFRTRYPLPKLDVIVSPTGGDPCESEGIVFLPSRSVAFYKLSPESKKEIVSNVYKYVLKQWLGGIVSFHSWADLWLDEALTEYIIYALARLENKKSSEDDDKFEMNMQHALCLEASEEIPALAREDPFLDFDDRRGPRKAARQPRKGELLLHMFDAVLGPDGIRNALQELLVKRKHQTITENDLWTELANGNNESFPGAGVAHAWTHSAGFPLVTVSRVYGQKTAVVRQERYGDNSSKTLWSIPITYTDGTKMDFDNTASVFWLHTKEAKLPSAPKDDDWLIANLRGTGYYRVNYDPRNWNLITMELNTYHTNIDVLNRARIIDDVFELADINLVPYGTALHASEYLRREKEVLPWTTVLKRWEYLEAMLGTGIVLEKWKLFIIRILIHHIHSFKWSHIEEDKDKRKLRVIHYAWACKYSYGPCMIEARHAFESYKSPQPTAKPMLAEHQFTVFCSVVEDGGESEWETLRLRLARVNGSAERRNIILSLGCTKSHEILMRYFEEFSAPRFNMVPLIFAEAARHGKLWRARATEYVLTNWQQLKMTFPRRFQDILSSVFKYISSDDELSDVNMLLRRNRWSLLRYTSVFDSIEEAARKNMRWIDAHLSEVTRWLKRDVAEFILDDQVLHGNGTFSGVGNGTRDEEDAGSLDIREAEDHGEVGVFGGRLEDEAIHATARSGIGKVADNTLSDNSDAAMNHRDSREYDQKYKDIARTKADLGGSTLAISVDLTVAASTGNSRSRSDSIDPTLAKWDYGLVTNVTVLESDAAQEIRAKDDVPGRGSPQSPADRHQGSEDRADIRENASDTKENSRAYVGGDHTSVMSKSGPSINISSKPEKTPHVVVQDNPAVVQAAGSGSPLAGQSHVLANGASGNISGSFLSTTGPAGGEGTAIDILATAETKFPSNSGHSNADNIIPEGGSKIADVNALSTEGNRYKSDRRVGADIKNATDVRTADSVALGNSTADTEPATSREIAKTTAVSSLTKIVAATDVAEGNSGTKTALASKATNTSDTSATHTSRVTNAAEGTGATKGASVPFKAELASDGPGIAPSDNSSGPGQRRGGVDSEDTSNGYFFADDYEESGDSGYAVNEGSG